MSEGLDNKNSKEPNKARVSDRHAGGNLPQHGQHGQHDEETVDESEVSSYWRENLRLMLSLLAIWFLVSFGFGILLVDFLNQFQFFGFKMGFWWAQQGSIYVFVVLIFVYVVRMKQIDRKHGVDDSSDSDDQQD